MAAMPPIDGDYSDHSCFTQSKSREPWRDWIKSYKFHFSATISPNDEVNDTNFTKKMSEVPLLPMIYDAS